VSVPGMYQKPAPYSEHTLTYSTALAFTGRSAACAPPTASKPAAEPRTRLLNILILNLQVASVEKGRSLKAPAYAFGRPRRRLRPRTPVRIYPAPENRFDVKLK